MSEPDTKMPSMIALVLLIIGVVIAAITGFSAGGSIAGGVIAGLGIAPSAWGMWAGIQHKTQAGMVMPVLMFLACVAAGGILIVVGIIDWLR